MATIEDQTGKDSQSDEKDVRVYQPARVGIWRRANYKGILPERITAVESALDNGDTEPWADLVSFMLRTDPHLRSVYTTMVTAVAGSVREISPGPAEPGQEEWAAKVADFVRDSFENAKQLGSVLEAMTHAEGVGWQIVENDWKRIRGQWHNVNPTPVHSRDVRFARDWMPEIRTYRSGGPEWIRANDLPPGSFMIHIPGFVGEAPNMAGSLLACVWPWIWKRWGNVFQQEGMEKYANPLALGKVGENATQEAVDTLHNALENLSGGRTGVLRGDTTVDFLEASSSGQSAWSAALEGYNNEITKAILGSTLNVEAGDAGNRALGESQFYTTILPRLKAFAERLAETIERDWFTPLVRFNAHVLGQDAPIPKLTFFADDHVGDKEPVDQAVLNVLVTHDKITTNEVRSMGGLEPLPEELGGEAPVSKSIDELSGEGKSQAAALNGAQITALGSLGEKVSAGLMPAETAIQIALIGFPITEAQARAIFDPIGDAAPAPTQASDDPGAYSGIRHQPGGEWRVVDASGESVGVYRTKGEAVDALREHESGKVVSAKRPSARATRTK